MDQNNILRRAQSQAVDLLRTLTQLQGTCANIHGTDFHAVCRSIDRLEQVTADLQQIQQARRHG